MENIEMYNRSNQFAYYLDEMMLEKYKYLLTWKEHETVADIGMADAKFTVNGLIPRLPKDFKMLFGFDVIPSRVEFCKKSYNNPKLNFMELDIQTRTLPPNLHLKFDHVFLFYVLHLVYDLRQAVENIFTMLKPGAEAFITIVEKGLDVSFYNLSQNPKWAPYGHEKYISKFFPVEDRLPMYRNLFMDAGFVDVNCFREQATFRHESKDVGREFFRSVSPVTSGIPKDELDEYMRDFISELTKIRQYMVKICPDTNEEICSSSIVCLTIYAKKPALK